MVYVPMSIVLEGLTNITKNGIVNSTGEKQRARCLSIENGQGETRYINDDPKRKLADYSLLFCVFFLYFNSPFFFLFAVVFKTNFIAG